MRYFLFSIMETIAISDSIRYQPHTPTYNLSIGKKLLNQLEVVQSKIDSSQKIITSKSR